MAPLPTTEDALAFALKALGPASEQFVGSPEQRALLQSALRSGSTLEDAVLARVFSGASDDPWLAEEFTRWLLRDLDSVTHGLLADGPRRLMDTRDLVQSVFGDLWSEVFDLRFETRGQFRALVIQRLRWKAATWSRALTRQKRDERLRVEAPIEDVPIASTSGPELEAEGKELAARVIQAMARMSDRDRKVLRMHLSGASMAEIRAELDVSADAARKILQRVRDRVRSQC